MRGLVAKLCYNGDSPGDVAGTLRISELKQNDLTAGGAFGRYIFEGLHGNR